MWQYVAYMAARTILGTNAETKVAKAQNKTAMTQLGKEINQINLERAASRQRTGQALFNIQIQGQNAMSQVGLQAAASGTVGASVQDAVSTVQIATDRQKAGAMTQQEQQEEGFRLMVSKAVDTAHASMDWESGADKLYNNILQNGMQAAGHYAAQGLAGDNAPDSSKAKEPGGAYSNYGYDLWGNKGPGNAGAQSWKSYLGNS
ncbi:internal virion protein [Shigella phage Buco]|uniref:Internal virion protein n=1 Tax=Shigella phage Buco TaxID=2530183 RepID=A0A482JGR7_9CAUD|nr:internal virion protein [Shigella phage Buco]QBP32941.1 hypothetical protein HRP29_gp41 [Shigella phage Buco]